MKVTAQKIGDVRIDTMVFIGQLAIPVNRSALDQQGRAAVEKLLGDDLVRKLTPPPRAEQDSDGDWSVVWESNSDAKFRLDLQQKAVGAMFESVCDHGEALALVKLHTLTGFEGFGTHTVVAMFLRMQSRFLLPEGATNKDLALQTILSSAEHGPFENLRQDMSKMGRFDLKFSLRHKDKYDAFFTVELPANRDHRTVWTELALRTRTDTRIEASTEEVEGIVDSAYDLYCTSYAEYVEKLLGGQDVTYLD